MLIVVNLYGWQLSIIYLLKVEIPVLARSRNAQHVLALYDVQMIL